MLHILFFNTNSGSIDAWEEAQTKMFIGTAGMAQFLLIMAQTLPRLTPVRWKEILLE
jgi:hypothetical protein